MLLYNFLSLTCIGGDSADMFCVAVGGSHFCWAVLLALIMPPDGCFVPDPPSCVSSPLYMIGVERMLPSGYGLLDSLGGDILISWALKINSPLVVMLTEN